MARKSKRDRKERHQQSLTEQLEDPEENGVRTVPRRKRHKLGAQDETQVVDDKTTAKIAKVAREQQEDVEAEDNVLLGPKSEVMAGILEDEASDSEADSDAEYGEGASSFGDDIEVSPEDEAAVARFLNPAAKQKTLADIILEKIKQKEEQQQHQQQQAGRTPGPSPAGEIGGEIDERVRAVYKGIGQIMSRFTVGKVPKAFKIIPNLQNWEEVLYLTEPERWSPHAVALATRMFVSNLRAKLAQRFLALVLLPAVREDIAKNKRLHFALFQALKKATFKPDAFFKGVLLPLCREGDCSLREAVIISSVINRSSIPVVHAGAALLRLAEMPYAGTTSFFIRVLLDKKYALPYRAVDALVDHFLRFQQEERELPVVWHQSLLVFVQRYKHEIRREDQNLLRKLVKTQYHYKVTPEIVRELDDARARGEKAKEEEQKPKASKVAVQKAVEDPSNFPPVLLMEED